MQTRLYCQIAGPTHTIDHGLGHFLMAAGGTLQRAAQRRKFGVRTSTHCSRDSLDTPPLGVCSGVPSSQAFRSPSYLSPSAARPFRAARTSDRVAVGFPPSRAAARTAASRYLRRLDRVCQTVAMRSETTVERREHAYVPRFRQRIGLESESSKNNASAIGMSAALQCFEVLQRLHGYVVQSIEDAEAAGSLRDGFLQVGLVIAEALDQVGALRRSQAGGKVGVAQEGHGPGVARRERAGIGTNDTRGMSPQGG